MPIYAASEIGHSESDAPGKLRCSQRRLAAMSRPALTQTLFVLATRPGSCQGRPMPPVGLVSMR